MAIGIMKSLKLTKPFQSKRCLLTLLLLSGAVNTFLWSYPTSSAETTKQIDATESATVGQLIESKKKWESLDDPSRDGWATEEFNLRAGEQLKKLGNLLLEDRVLSSTDTAPFVTDNFSCESIWPENHRIVYDDGIFEILRFSALEPEKEPSSPKRPLNRLFGAEGFAKSLNSLFSLFRDAEEIHHKAKIIGVKPVGNSVTTKQYFSSSGKTPQGMIEQHSTWVIEWEPAESGQPPKMRDLRLEDIEVTRIQSKGKPLFSDVTESVLEKNSSYVKQVLQGMNHWLQRSNAMKSERRDSGYEFGTNTPGIALGDVNGDGLEDLYLCQENGLPNLLFLHESDGTLRDVSEEWGADWIQDTRSALFLDWDNDGDQDLVVAIRGGVVIAENIDQKSFKFRGLIETSNDNMSLASADYDKDGDLDLYVCTYNRNLFYDSNQNSNTNEEQHAFVPHDGNNGGKNTLLRNEGSGRFLDVTNEVGLGVHNQRYSFAAAWEDYDNDGDPDLYVANDFGRDNLYQNDDGIFKEISSDARIEDSATGMGVAWGDFNRDGWMDSYISNMWSSAGRRVTHQPKFKADNPTVRKRLQRFARGNTLLKNNGHGGFDDVSGPAGVEMGRWAWSDQFVDLNNDGWEDLVVANGYLTGVNNSGDL